MNAVITPSQLAGTVQIPPSKSIAHRAIICAALANGTSKIHNVDLSQDVQATLNAVCQLGAQSQYLNRTLYITGIRSASPKAEIDCGESGSTLRFLMPVAAALNCVTRFLGHGKLPQRPISPYGYLFPKHGVKIRRATNHMPIIISGQLRPGMFFMDGTISSQFITGLLLALPGLEHSSEIQICGTLESRPYVNMTISVLQQFGVSIHTTTRGYIIPGNQQFFPQAFTVEGDHSQAAYFEVAGCCGNPITIQGLCEDSVQGDKAMLKLISNCGAAVNWEEDAVTVSPKTLSNFHIDVSQTPDIAPAAAVLGCLCPGRSIITGIRRLQLKESNRIASIVDSLKSIGGKISVKDNTIVTDGPVKFRSGRVNSHMDHRIAMAGAIAASFASGSVTIEQAECVKKSYPQFFLDYQRLGGKADGVCLE